MALRDLGAFLEDDGLEYPLPASAFEVKPGQAARYPEGKTYRVPSPSAKTGLWLTAIADIGVKAARGGGNLSADELAALNLDDDEEKSLYRRILGGTYDEMIADGVKYPVLQRIGQDAYLCFAMSSETADMALASLGKAPAVTNRAQRRAAGKTAASKSRRASTATSGSARGTTSRTSRSSTSRKPPGEAKTG